MPSALPLVTLHGFLGDPRDFEAMLAFLPARTVIPITLPGHGPSPQTEYARSLDGCLEAILRAVASAHTGDGPVDVLAYSMGGRMALELMARGELPVRRAAVIGAGTGFVDAPGRTTRRQLDADRAHQLRTEGLAAFLDSWFAMPLFVGLRTARSVDEI